MINQFFTRINLVSPPYSLSDACTIADGSTSTLVLRFCEHCQYRTTCSFDPFTKPQYVVETLILKPPRLVFVETNDPGMWVNHFVAYFSRNGRKLTLVDPPPHVGAGIGPRLRLAWPHKVELTDRPPDGGIYTVSLKGSYGCE